MAVNLRRGFWRLTFVVWLLGLGVLLVGAASLRQGTLGSSPFARVHPESGDSEPPGWLDLPAADREAWVGPLPRLRTLEQFARTRLGFEEWPQDDPERQSYEARLEEIPEARQALEDMRAQWRSESAIRITTEDYARDLGLLAGLSVFWSIWVWGGFYLAMWIASGFRGDQPDRP